MKMKRRFISIFLCLALILTSFAAMHVVQASAADTAKQSTGSSNRGELVLKAWNWPISVIQNNLNAIAEAGFTVIETSPINGIVGSGNRVEDWYQFYQPTNYNIGNKIGTETEFKNLCSAANAKGIKIIVDVVLNHTTDQTGMVTSSLKHYHSSTNEITNYDSRYDVTQYRLHGLPDLDTSRSDIQTLANTFLKKLISDGASGFRFDAAKHIELPSQYDGSYNCASNYWPNALNGVNDTFSYGEILGGTKNANYKDYEYYMNYMKVIAANYRGGFKNNLDNWQLPASSVGNLGYDADNLVCYVETHDNFVNGDFGMSNFLVQLGWAAIAAQGNNCMYLARPAGTTSNGYDQPGTGVYGTNNVYDGGDGAYLRDEVVRVNKFHNAMSGQGTNCFNINNNNQVLAVRRGTKGVCIINAGASDVTLSSYNMGVTSLSGSYTSNGQSFTVSNGNVSGKVKAGQIYTIYNGSGESSQPVDYYLTGDSAAVFGTAWATGLAANKMTYSNGVYTKTYTDVPAGTIQYKVTGAEGWGDSEIPASGNQSVTVPTSGSTVTFKIQSGVLSAEVTSSSPVEPEEPTTDGNFYLSVGAPYTDSNPKWYIWTWGSGSGRAVQGTYDSTSQCYKFTDFDSNIIVLRVDPSSTFNGSSWSNPPVWTQGSDIAVPSGCNKLTINDWTLTGTWSSYVPKYDYTVKYNYDLDGTQKTITKNVSQTTETNATKIAQVNDPSSRISNVAYTYKIGTCTKSGTTITVDMTKTANTYSVTLNGTTIGSNYKYLDKATVTSTTDTGFIIDGSLIKTGKSLTVYVTGDLNITTDNSVSHQDTATINQTASYFSDDKIAYELLATANVNDFARMGVVFCKGTKTKAQLQNAINGYTTLGGTQVVNGIAVHNSNVNMYNESGLYQFRYAPYLTNVPSNGATLNFYTFAVTNSGTVVLSDAKLISVPNSFA